MTHDEQIAIIQAMKEGKKIQCRADGWNDDLWTACFHDAPNFVDWIYRVKPEPPKPREWWLCTDTPERIYEVRAYDVHQAGVDAQHQIHVREVLPVSNGSQSATASEFQE